jgi:hypothetical protein
MYLWYLLQIWSIFHLFPHFRPPVCLYLYIIRLSNLCSFFPRVVCYRSSFPLYFPVRKMAKNTHTVAPSLVGRRNLRCQPVRIAWTWKILSSRMEFARTLHHTHQNSTTKSVWYHNFQLVCRASTHVRPLEQNSEFELKHLPVRFAKINKYFQVSNAEAHSDSNSSAAQGFSWTVFNFK